MKSEHRHELKTNELGRLTSQVTQLSEKYARQNGTMVIVVGCAALLAVAGVVYWLRSSGATDPAGWKEMTTADSPTAFGSIADKYPKTKVGAWARIREGEEYLSSGVQAMFVDRDAALSDLKKAREAFEKLVDDPLAIDFQDRGLFGLARTLESTAGKDPADLSKAIEVYKKIANSPTSVYKSVADARIRELEKPGAKEFYAWFYSQKPKPSDRPMPKDLFPPAPSEPVKGIDAKGGSATDAGATDAAKSPTAKTEPPKVDTKSTAPPKTEAPKTESTKSEPAQAGAAKEAAPKAGGPKSGATKSE